MALTVAGISIAFGLACAGPVWSFYVVATADRHGLVKPRQPRHPRACLDGVQCRAAVCSLARAAHRHTNSRIAVAALVRTQRGAPDAVRAVMDVPDRVRDVDASNMSCTWECVCGSSRPTESREPMLVMLVMPVRMIVCQHLVRVHMLAVLGKVQKTPSATARPSRVAASTVRAATPIAGARRQERRNGEIGARAGRTQVPGARARTARTDPVTQETEKGSGRSGRGRRQCLSQLQRASQRNGAGDLAPLQPG